jgi:anhydro-N-acetylmuramic acid kinase
VNNLGGISNITSIDSTLKAEPTVLAFDTGPANVLIDLAMRYFTRGQAQMDRNGAWAVRGRVCETALKQWLTHPYFLRKPPKSTGRELFGEPFWQRVLPQMRTARLSRFDIVATLTELTARSLALNCKLHLKSWPQTFILTGGGAANPALVKSIQAALAAAGPGTELLTSEMSGWPLQSVEPAAFALLAYLRIKRQTGNLPQTTGARRAVRLGQISDP